VLPGTRLFADAARIYAKRVGASREVVNRAAEYKLRAERKLGEILAGFEKAKGAGQYHRGSTGSARERVPTIGDAGISRKLSSRAKALAAIPQETFESKTAEATERAALMEKRHTFTPANTHDWQDASDGIRQCGRPCNKGPCRWRSSTCGSTQTVLDS